MSNSNISNITTRTSFKQKLDIFRNLPRYKKCCFCINLKLGCYIISVVYLLFIGEAFSGRSASKEFSKCYSSGEFMKLLGYVALALAILTFITSLIFLYGITSEKGCPLISFMYLTLFLLAFNVITSLVMVFLPAKDTCSTPYLFGGATFFGAIMLIYCLVIVNSYYRSLKVAPYSETASTI